MQKIGKFFSTLDQGVYRITVAAFICLVIYEAILPYYPMKHIDYMLNAVFVIASLTKAATMRAAAGRAIATLFGILVGAFIFLRFGHLDNYWLAMAGGIFLVSMATYITFGYYVNVAVMVCWIMMMGGNLDSNYNLTAFVVERVVTNAIGIGVCLLVYMVWPPKTNIYKFSMQAAKLIEDFKADAVAQLTGKQPVAAQKEQMGLQALINTANVINDEASVSLKGTRDPRMSRVILEIKAAMYNLNMLRDTGGELDEENKKLLHRAFGVDSVVAPQGEEAEVDDTAFNFHIMKMCQRLLTAEHFNRKVKQ